MGSASGVLKTVDGVGISLGIAGFGAIFFSIVGRGGAQPFWRRANGRRWRASRSSPTASQPHF